MGLMDHLH